MDEIYIYIPNTMIWSHKISTNQMKRLPIQNLQYLYKPVVMQQLSKEQEQHKTKNRKNQQTQAG